MKEAKNLGETVKMVRDKLFINNEEYILDRRQPHNNKNLSSRGALTTPPPEPRQRQPVKRPRVGSTPEKSD